MNKSLFSILILMVLGLGGAAAQQPKLSDEEQEARTAYLMLMRNQLSDTVIALQARVHVLEAEAKKVKPCDPKK